MENVITSFFSNFYNTCPTKPDIFVCTERYSQNVADDISSISNIYRIDTEQIYILDDNDIAEVNNLQTQFKNTPHPKGKIIRGSENYWTHISQVYKIQKCDELRKSIMLQRYDCIVRVRPDILYINKFDWSQLDMTKANFVTEKFKQGIRTTGSTECDWIWFTNEEHTSVMSYMTGTLCEFKTFTGQSAERYIWLQAQKYNVPKHDVDMNIQLARTPGGEVVSPLRDLVP